MTPLIPSYVFVQIEEQHRNEVFQVPGVVHYLFWLGKPAKVRDVEILQLKQGLKDTTTVVKITNLKPGDVVDIKEIPFKVKEGIV
jgi:transcriptional antiterminator RfaH